MKKIIPKFKLTKPRLGVLSDLLTNLSTVWFAVILIAPGLGATKSLTEIISMLTANLPWGILSLIAAMELAEVAK